MRLSQHQVEKLSRLLLELHSQRDFCQLPQLLIRIVKDLVPTDISTYNEIDHNSGQLRAAHDFPGDAEKHFPAFMAHAAGHPLLRHIAETGDTSAWRTSDFVSQRGFERTPIYNEFFRHFGIRYQAAVFLPRSTGFEVGLALQRCNADFTEEERQLLDFFGPHFSLAWRNARDLALAGASQADDSSLARTRQERVLLDGLWRVRDLSESAQLTLERFFQIRLQNGQRLPVFLREWLKRKTSLHAETLLNLQTNESISARSEGETATLAWLPESPMKSWLVITVRTPVGVALKRTAHGLTPREAEVLKWVMAGKSNPEIGLILKTSPNTVRKHLERVYVKLGVENRAAAMRVIWENKAIK